MIFKLKDRCGSHTMEDGRKIKAGEHVRSDTDLVKRFRGKFERVRVQEDVAELPSEADLLGKDSNSISDDSDKVDEIDDDSTSSEESIDEPENNDEDTEDDENNDDDKDEDEESNDDENNDDESEKIDPKTLGKEVTDRFPKAKKINAQVFMPSNGWYVAYDPEDQSLLSVKGKKLQKKAMATLLETYEDED